MTVQQAELCKIKQFEIMEMKSVVMEKFDRWLNSLLWKMINHETEPKEKKITWTAAQRIRDTKNNEN